MTSEFSDYPSITFTQPDGQTQKGFDIPVSECEEKFNQYTLDDGTVLRIRSALVAVTRLEDQYDEKGRPIYIAHTQNIVHLVDVHPSLVRRAD